MLGPPRDETRTLLLLLRPRLLALLLSLDERRGGRWVKRSLCLVAGGQSRFIRRAN